MVHSCIVPGCFNRSNKPSCKGIKFFTLPTTKKIRQVWLSLIGRRSSEVSFHSRICSEHFVNGKKTVDSIPELFPWQRQVVTPTKDAPTTSTATASIPTSRCTPALSPLDIVYHDHCYFTSPTQPSTHLAPILDTSVALPLSTDDTVDIGTQISLPPFSVEYIADDDAAIQFYTGFSTYKKFEICYNFLGSAVHHLKYWGRPYKVSAVENRGSSRALSPLNEFFLVLCRLRCGLMETDLAYRFQISQPTVSRILITWINFLYFKFKDIDLWPSKEHIQHFMPQIFKDFYPSTRCIIDATELFIQFPSNPQAQQLTFSSYKNHNTLKALVCITPSGAISFISKLHGGSISDRELFEKSGLLDMLEAGDSVMADRGFTIADLLDAKGVTLNMPPMKVNNQLSEREMVTTRRIAALRIHVERAIGRIKNYKILNDIPNCMSRNTDQIFFICCMLCNFSSPLCK